MAVIKATAWLQTIDFGHIMETPDEVSPFEADDKGNLDGNSSEPEDVHSDLDATPEPSKPVPVYSYYAAADDKNVSEETSLQAIRSSWQFAAVIQFCRMFASTLKLKNFSADFLERVMLAPSDYRCWVAELCYKLLRPDPSLPYTEKDSERWERMLLQRVTKRWWDSFASNPLRNNSFFSISPMMRVLVLYALCEWRAQDDPYLREHMRSMAEEAADGGPDPLRHPPVGEDAEGNRYFYFSTNNEDCRLYREGPVQPLDSDQPSAAAAVAATNGHAGRGSSSSEDDQQQALPDGGEQAGERLWATQTTTLEELQDFAEQFADSSSSKEQALYSMLQEQVLPRLVETAAARKRAEEKAAILAALPKKRSNRLQDLEAKKEEEERLAREREVAQRRRAEDKLREKERRRKERDKEMRLYIEQQRRILAEDAQLSPRSAARKRQQRATNPAANGLRVPPPRPLHFGRGRPKKVQLQQIGRQLEYFMGWSPMADDPEFSFVITGLRTTQYKAQRNKAMLVETAGGEFPLREDRPMRTLPLPPGVEVPRAGDFDDEPTGAASGPSRGAHSNYSDNSNGEQFPSGRVTPAAAPRGVPGPAAATAGSCSWGGGGGRGGWGGGRGRGRRGQRYAGRGEDEEEEEADDDWVPGARAAAGQHAAKRHTPAGRGGGPSHHHLHPAGPHHHHQQQPHMLHPYQQQQQLFQHQQQHAGRGGPGPHNQQQQQPPPQVGLPQPHAQQQQQWHQDLMNMLMAMPPEERQKLQALPGEQRQQLLAGMLQRHLRQQQVPGGGPPAAAAPQQQPVANGKVLPGMVQQQALYQQQQQQPAHGHMLPHSNGHMYPPGGLSNGQLPAAPGPAGAALAGAGSLPIAAPAASNGSAMTMSLAALQMQAQQQQGQSAGTNGLSPNGGLAPGGFGMPQLQQQQQQQQMVPMGDPPGGGPNGLPVGGGFGSMPAAAPGLLGMVPTAGAGGPGVMGGMGLPQGHLPASHFAGGMVPSGGHLHGTDVLGQMLAQPPLHLS